MNANSSSNSTVRLQNLYWSILDNPSAEPYGLGGYLSINEGAIDAKNFKFVARSYSQYIPESDFAKATFNLPLGDAIQYERIHASVRVYKHKEHNRTIDFLNLQLPGMLLKSDDQNYLQDNFLDQACFDEQAEIESYRPKVYYEVCNTKDLVNPQIDLKLHENDQAFVLKPLEP